MEQAQVRQLQSGALGAKELRRSVTETIERLNPIVNAVVISLFDRPGSGVPILLKDAGQELVGTSHWVGVAALRDADVTEPSWVSWRLHTLEARMETWQTHRSGTRLS